MRLLVISNLYPPDGYGGYERQTLELVEALGARNHEVTVLTSSVSTKSIASDSDKPNVRRLLHLSNEYMPLVEEPSYLQAQLLQSRLVNTHNISILCRLLAEARPDAILLCNLIGLGGLQMINTLNVLEVPWAWSLADTIPAKFCDLGELTDLIALAPVPKSAGRWMINGTFFSPSSRLYQDIADDGCQLDGALHVVPYWVDSDVPIPSQRTYFSPGQKLRLAFVGYVNENKGIDILLDAMKLLRESGLQERVSLDAYGGGDVDRYQQMSSDMNLPFVRFHGFKNSEQLNEVYAASDALLFPAMLREPFGNVSLEAAMRGCVPIIYRKCGAAEFLPDTQMSIHVDRDAQSFAKAVEDVLSGNSNLQQIGKAAAVAARERFKLKDAAASYEAVLQGIAHEFRATTASLHRACQTAMLVERLTFAQLERDLSAKRTSMSWLTAEVEQLKHALAEAKNGINAYDQALTGEKNKLSACEEKLSVLQNSRIWKLRQLLHPIIKQRL